MAPAERIESRAESFDGRPGGRAAGTSIRGWVGASRALQIALIAGLLGSVGARAEVWSTRLVEAPADFARGRTEGGLSLRNDGLHATQEGVFVSTVRGAGRTFSAIGPHWRGARGARVEIAVSPDGLSWGRWIAVPSEGVVEATREDGEPNPFAGEALGALIFVAPSSRFFRYRVRLLAGMADETGLRRIAFHLIDPGESARETPGVARPDADGEAEKEESVAGGIGRRSLAPEPEMPLPVARPRKPAIASRAAWGARPPRYEWSYTLAGHLGIHHTASIEDYTAETWEECAARMRAIQTYHMETNGWNDIGYAWAICRHGDVFQAREDDDDETDVLGAHDGFNRGSVGITVFGYFHPPVDQRPTDAQVASLEELIAWLSARRNIDPLGRTLYAAFGAPVDNVYGHREVKATDCPGDHLFALKELIRSSARDRLLVMAY